MTTYDWERTYLFKEEQPSTIRERLCGEPSKRMANHVVIQVQAQDNNRQHKKQKSQRRIEKEAEYFQRMKRMEEGQKAKLDNLKKTKCKFFEQGRCAEGANCRFGH